MLLSAVQTHRMDEATTLLDLPDPCLLATLRVCAEDDERDNQLTLPSAARAHSRLRQAAVLALDTINRVYPHMQGLERALLYLRKYPAHVTKLQLQSCVCRSCVSCQQRGLRAMCGLRLGHLPAGLQLEKLLLTRMQVQLLPSCLGRGVLQPGLPLKHLRLADCTLLDGMAGLAAALQSLPTLELLRISDPQIIVSDGLQQHPALPAQVLEQLQQLTTLVLTGDKLDDAALQSLAQLTRLRILRLLPANNAAITASVLAGMQQLTVLELGRIDPYAIDFHPVGLAATPHLRKLHLNRCVLHGAAAGGMQMLLSQLQKLMKLTHLHLPDSLSEPLWRTPPDVPPAA